MIDGLNRAMEHIESRLDGRLDVAELARLALTSEYHLRRMFSALAGMPLSEYVRRRRLTVAGAEVLDGRRTLLEIAVRYGYGSAEAFGRAFRALHGVGPGEARRTGAALRSQPKLRFSLTVEGSTTMRYRIVEKEAFRVVGPRARVPLVYEGVNPAIEEFVRGIPSESVGRLEELSDGEPSGIVAVCDGMDESRAEGTELDYYHGVVTGAPAPEGAAELAVPAGTWVVFENEGPFPSALQEMWRDSYADWFPSNPYRTVPGPELLRVELSEDGTRARGELWLPVERTG
ncbi:AraC family transcriptional regulator [Streptomyces sp. OF8]|uniref:AraC family transcriptional regulator n=2 Tax=Streptomyces alkaliterrae TaxID=2213162 RepID=A0A5P0YYR0_9ACTN|nr:AraC family transcriptional regulator [Streptomyces alkaliterrae]MBB1261344.1 AraC family transcriptional regulator [Streptomyces alkaliterrae]MQS05424.1 helix-turn-helix domain-containing protein [Streptomyces alkaliterrae]